MPKQTTQQGGEKEYPIWRITARWDNANYKNNGTSFAEMYRRNFTQATMDKRIKKWFERYVAKKYPNENIEPIELKAEYMGTDTWVLMWFAHKTFNTFETVAEAEKSFANYVDSMKLDPDSDPVYDTSMRIDKNGNKHCLMGAEDRFRWEVCQKKCCKNKNHTIITH